MSGTLLRRGFAALVLVTGLALGASAQTPSPPASPKAAPKLQTFASPMEAAEALTNAVRKDDERAIALMLGASWRDFVPGTREDEDDARAEYLEAWDKQHKIQMPAPDKALVEVGTTGFTMPIPIVRQGERWVFDIDAGYKEMTARQIGYNEVTVIQALLALVDAQREYALRDPMNTGVATYARRILSSPGKKDGLYWETKPGEEQSPLGPLLAKAQPGQTAADGFYGYHYRLLYGQGASAPGGAHSYLVNNRMIGGFGVIAWPVRYGETGVMTFIVDFRGEIHEKDLGPNTAAEAGKINIYDPDKSWEKSDLNP